MLVSIQNINNSPDTSVKKDVKTRAKADLKRSDIYDYYIKNKIGQKISSILFNDILTRYNQLVVDKVLDGEVVKLYPNFGELMIIECPRKDTIVHSKTKDILPNLRCIDWGETNRLNIRNEEGKLVRQFFSADKQPEFYKIHWSTTFANSTNIKLFKFKRSLWVRKAIPKRLKEDNLVNIKYSQNRQYLYTLKNKEVQFLR